MIDRRRHRTRVEQLLSRHRAVAILGPRQAGKTTLARAVMEAAPTPAIRFDLEDPDDLARLAEPKLALEPHTGLVVIDEVQRRPDLFPVLRVLIDRPRASARFLILGSASPELLRQTSETLAGRIVFHELHGFDVDEVGEEGRDQLWLRGGFPRSFLAETDEESVEWRQAFVQTFLERDLPQLGVRVPGVTLGRFWRMLAHYHGQVWNASDFARSFGVSAAAVRRYLDLLTQALVVEQLQPWFENVGKRQVKAPKVFVADSGVLHTLLGLRTRPDLEGHPKIGASWEGFVLREIVSRLGVGRDERFFWATHAGAELDLLVVRGRERRGFEIKRTTAPALSKSLRTAHETLRLDALVVVHAGEHTFPLADRVRAVAIGDLERELAGAS